MGCIPSNGKFGKSSAQTHIGVGIYGICDRLRVTFGSPTKNLVWLIQVNFCFPVQCG